MSITFSSSYDETMLIPWVGKWKNAGRGSHGYERRQVSEYQADIVSDGPERMGKHFRVPGACWQAMRDSDLPVDEFPEFCLERGGKPTRLDLCVNLHEALTPVDMLYELATLGHIRTRAKLDKYIHSSHEAGFYVGSRKSDKFMRIYDKRLEQENPGGSTWIRLELQMRKRYAAAMTILYSRQPDKRAFINRAVQDYCDFPSCDEVQEALSVQDGDLPLIRRKPPKFIHWLEDQVIPAMLNYQTEHPEIDMLRMFSLLYHEQHSKRKSDQ